MSALAAAHGPSALWYATRGAGATTLLLLTVSVVLGIAEVRRWRPAGAPLFGVAALHRTVSLLALALLVVHIVSTLLDPFPRIGILTAVVPFSGSYRPLWVGLGAIAFDLLLALVLTSLVRRRLGYRAWRALHWTAYAVWPVALVHGLGAGSDARSAWMQALTLACVAAAAVAVAARLASGDTPAAARGGAAASIALAAIALAVWLGQGPLARGWARRAGTPPSVLAAFAPRHPRITRAAAPDALARPFSADLAGPVAQGESRRGGAVVDLRLRLTGPPRGVLRIRLGGAPAAGGGVQVHKSAITLGPASDPGRYSGRLESLAGSELRALVGGPGGQALRLEVHLSLGADRATGQLSAAPARAGGGA